MAKMTDGKDTATQKNDASRDKADQDLQKAEQDLQKDPYTASSGQHVKENVGKSQYSKYHTGPAGRTGHGFAAEDANALADELRGRAVDKVGVDNARNGADRVVEGVKIQTKYCRTASQTVRAALDPESGLFRYRVRNGRPMKLEVPRDQYDDCVRLVRRLIAEGKVPGVKNPDHAVKMVRPGFVTYRQSLRIAKAGTVESVTYDAFSGAVTSTSAAGISAAIAFAIELKRGECPKKALKTAARRGAVTGGTVLATNVIVSQCTRKAAEQAAKKAAETAGRSVASKVGAAAVKVGAKTNVVSAAVTTLVMSHHDIAQTVKGRIPVTECAKNVSVNLTSVTGGLAAAQMGAACGTALGPVGTFVGGLIGGIIGSIASESGAKLVFKKFWK